MGHECPEHLFAPKMVNSETIKRLRIQLVSSTLGIFESEQGGDDGSGMMVVGDHNVDGEYDENGDQNHQ